MNDTATREPPELRLLDVLLEEELRRHPGTAAQPPSAPRGRRVLAVAAVLLLGIGVVLGVLFGARGEQTARPANQQGEEREVITPESAQQLAELLPKLESIVVTSRFDERPRADYPGLTEWRAEVRSLGARVAIADPVQLVQWMDALRTACGTEGTPPDDVPSIATVRLLLHGAREVDLALTHQGSLGCGRKVTLKVDGALAPLLARARRSADRTVRLPRGRAMDGEELALLPAELRELTCFGVPAAELATLLPRFTHLESLRCYPGGKTARVQLPEVLAALAPIDTLRTVRLPADLLSAPAATELARLRHVEDLTLEALPRDPARVATSVSLPAVPAGNGTGLPAAVPGIPNQPRTDLTALSAALGGMTQLRALRLLHCDGMHPAIQAVLGTRVEELQLDGSSVAVDDLRALAGLPTLRTLTLDLSTTPGDAAAVVAALGQLRQLTRLQLLHAAGQPAPVDSVRSALPQCAVTVSEYGTAPGDRGKAK